MLKLQKDGIQPVAELKGFKNQYEDQMNLQMNRTDRNNQS